MLCYATKVVLVKLYTISTFTIPFSSQFVSCAKKDVSIHTTGPNKCTYVRCAYCLVFVRQHVSIGVAIIIRADYKNIGNPTKFVTTVFQRLYNEFKTFFVKTERLVCAF
jgi:hypothetical protein